MATDNGKVAPTADLQSIDDPGEYNQRRRLKAIADRRERVVEVRREAWYRAEVSGQISERGRSAVVREAVHDFYLELRELIRRSDAAPAYLQGEPVEIDGETWDPEPLGSVYLPDHDRRYVFEGLRAWAQFPDPYIAEVVADRPTPNGYGEHPDGEQTVRREAIQIPRRVSLTALERLHRFMADAGLDAELEDELPVRGFRELDEETVQELKDMDNSEVVVDDRAVKNDE